MGNVPKFDFMTKAEFDLLVKKYAKLQEELNDGESDVSEIPLKNIPELTDELVIASCDWSKASKETRSLIGRKEASEEELGNGICEFYQDIAGVAPDESSETERGTWYVSYDMENEIYWKTKYPIYSENGPLINAWVCYVLDD